MQKRKDDDEMPGPKPGHDSQALKEAGLSMASKMRSLKKQMELFRRRSLRHEEPPKP